MPHFNKLVDLTVEVFIVYKNTVLLRKHDKYGIWLSVGGHVEKNEDPNEAAIREVKEEIGLDVELDNSLKPPVEYFPNYKELIPPYFMNRHRINKDHEHITLTYFARSKTKKIRQGKREISCECKWFNLSEIKENKEIMNHIKYYALLALKKLK